MDLITWNRPVERAWREVEFGVGQINSNSFDFWFGSFASATVDAGENLQCLADTITVWFHCFCFLYWLVDMGVSYNMAAWLAKIVPLWFIRWCERIYWEEVQGELGI